MNGNFSAETLFKIIGNSQINRQKNLDINKQRKAHFFFSGFVNFSVSFQYFLKRGFALKLPLTATEYYAYVCSLPCVESIKPMTVIDVKMGQNVNVQRYIKLSVLLGL